MFLITKATWGGAQRYVLDLATHIPQDEFEPIVAFGERGRLSNMLADSGIPIRPIPSLGRDIALISDVTSFFQILICLWRVRPDVVHLNSSKAAALGALAARIIGALPAGRQANIIFTVHGWPFNEKRSSLPRTLIYLISWFTALMSHATIVVSRSDEVQGKKMSAVADKIHYIPIGIEAPEYLSREEAIQYLCGKVPALKKTLNVPRIGTIAELTANKGISFAIEAIALLKRQGVNVLYMVLGEGEERGHLKTLARTSGVAERVLFSGFVSDAARYLKAFDVFLLPSIKEGMPYVLLEAGAAGLPIVMTTVVNPEVGERFQHIRAVPPADPEALAEALIETMREREENELFPSQNHFPLSDMVEKTALLYR